MEDSEIGTRAWTLKLCSERVLDAVARMRECSIELDYVLNQIGGCPTFVSLEIGEFRPSTFGQLPAQAKKDLVNTLPLLDAVLNRTFPGFTSDTGVFVSDVAYSLRFPSGETKEITALWATYELLMGVAILTDLDKDLKAIVHDLFFQFYQDFGGLKFELGLFHPEVCNPKTWKQEWDKLPA